MPLAADRRVPVRGMQRAMVKAMSAAWAVPHMGLCDEVSVDALMSLRGELRAPAAARGVAKLTFLPLLVKAASLALVQHPVMNAQLVLSGGGGGGGGQDGSADEATLVYRSAHNIGIAMDSPRGLVVPCVRDAQRLSVLEIARELLRLQALAAAGKLGERELADVTFSLSNIGSIGGTYASPIIPRPNVRLLRFAAPSAALALLRKAQS